MLTFENESDIFNPASNHKHMKEGGNMQNRQLEISISFYKSSLDLKERLIKTYPKRNRDVDQEIRYRQLEAEIRLILQFIGELESIRRRVRKKQTNGDY